MCRNLGLGFFFACALMLGAACGPLTEAEQKMDAGDYQSAIPLLEAYLAAHPDDTRTRCRLGYAYYHSADYDKALAAYNQVLAQSPGQPDAVLYAGLAYVNKGDYARAIALWRDYRNPGRPEMEQAVSRQLTLLAIKESQRLAQEALAAEKKLDARKPEGNSFTVCYYQDMTADQRLGPYQKALTAMVITELSKIRTVKVLERLRLQALLEEMALGQTGIVDQQTAPRVGKLLQSAHVLAGTLDVGSYRTTNSVAGDHSGSYSIHEKAIFDLPGKIAAMAAAVAGFPPTDAEKRLLAQRQTDSEEAVYHLGRALIFRDQGEWEQARQALDQALEYDPRFMLVKVLREGNPEAGMPTPRALKQMQPKAIAQAAQTAVSSAAQAEAQSQQAVNPMDMDSTTGDGGGGY